jgi:hypothetical protein
MPLFLATDALRYFHGTGGPYFQPAMVITLAKGEQIGRVDISSGPYHYATDDKIPPQWVAGMALWTSSRVYTFGDMTLGRVDQCILANKEVLLGFFGRSGVYIDQIGCIIGKLK